MGNDGLGKKAETKIRQWLDRPNDGYCFDRIPDQMTGFYGSRNICDFTLFKSPYFFYIESKATWEDSFPFAMISPYQYDNMLEKSKIANVFSWIIALFASYQRAFIFSIVDIDEYKQRTGKKSLNIKKIDSWDTRYCEIRTTDRRKQLLDYTGDIEEYVAIYLS